MVVVKDVVLRVAVEDVDVSVVLVSVEVMDVTVVLVSVTVVVAVAEVSVAVVTVAVTVVAVAVVVLVVHDPHNAGQKSDILTFNFVTAHPASGFAEYSAQSAWSGAPLQSGVVVVLVAVVVLLLVVLVVVVSVAVVEETVVVVEHSFPIVRADTSGNAVNTSKKAWTASQLSTPASPKSRITDPSIISATTKWCSDNGAWPGAKLLTSVRNSFDAAKRSSPEKDSKSCARTSWNVICGTRSSETVSTGKATFFSQRWSGNTLAKVTNGSKLGFSRKTPENDNSSFEPVLVLVTSNPGASSTTRCS